MTRDVLWRRRLAGGLAICGGQENRRRDAGATKTLRGGQEAGHNSSTLNISKCHI
jgi:hypothetical protein